MVASRAAVLGHPVGHSLSPVLHRAAYAELGLSGWTYDAIDVDEDELEPFLARLDDSWAGLSLTMPLKATVLPLLDEMSPTVRTVGGANTVLFRGGRLHGENTDVPGLVSALTARGQQRVDSAAVLGGGATARSAVAALGEFTDEVLVVVRDPGRVAGLSSVAASAGVRLSWLPWDDAAEALTAPLVVTTTPSGATDLLRGEIPPSPGTLFEVLYDPWPTALADAWVTSGGLVVDGLDLLVHQAVLQIELMTGIAVDQARLVAVLRATGERVLDERAARTSRRYP